ncbi:hypothetical protein FQR65_LT15013 [Abscondita terminalis]|nr:hypothetical protein FQR65_LT15013 [Abscondita terminalis]
MAHNNMLVLSVFVVVIFLTTVQTKRYRQQLRPANEFQELDLGVTRGFGKRALGMHIIHNFGYRQKSPPDRELVDRSQRGLQEMEIPVARGFGKRNSNLDVDTIKQFLEDWDDLKTKLDNMKVSQDKSSELSFVNDE